MRRSETLVNRTGLAAADGARVNGSETAFEFERNLIAQFFVSLSGGTMTALLVKAVIEGTLDGTNWFPVCRFADLSAAGGRLAGLPAIAAASEAALVATDDLSGAAASATLLDRIPLRLRGATKVQTFTANTGSPLVAVTLTVQSA